MTTCSGGCSLFSLASEPAWAEELGCAGGGGHGFAGAQMGHSEHYVRKPQVYGDFQGCVLEVLAIVALWCPLVKGDV